LRVGTQFLSVSIKVGFGGLSSQISLTTKEKGYKREKKRRKKAPAQLEKGGRSKLDGGKC